MLESLNWKILSGIIVGVVVLVVILVSSIDRTVVTDSEAVLVTEAVQERVPTIGSLMRSSNTDELGTLQVYVDRSASMQPYSNNASKYTDLLEMLDTQLANSSMFYGFGVPGGEEQSQVVEEVDALDLEQPEAYTWINNDYGELFDGLDEQQSHIAISDGVQSVPEGGARQSSTVRAIGNWLEHGGVFSLMVYRVPYQGTYYHEEPTTGTVQYDCTDRPIYLYGFFPTVSAKEKVMEILEMEELLPDHQLTVGQASVDLQVQERRFDRRSERGGHRGPLLLHSLKNHSNDPNLKSVFSGHATDENQWEVDVQLDTTALPWRSLSDAERGTVSENLSIDARHWRIDTLDAKNERIALQPTDALEVINPERFAEDIVHIRADVLPPDFNANNPRTASLLTIGLDAGGASRLISDDLSTRRDNSPDACNQTLNVQSVMGAILRDYYTAGQTLLITLW